MTSNTTMRPSSPSTTPRSPVRRWPAIGLLAGLALSFASPIAADEPVGAARLDIMAHNDNVQKSNFGTNSFLLRNIGDKDIVEFELDVTEALFPDTVFDPAGKAGDSVAKPLKFDRNTATGAVHHPGPTGPHYIGPGGDRGYERLLIAFDPQADNGFNPGEALGFSIDMDPNSIAGTRKRPLDQGSNPPWDVGGVSGAELIGSTFRITFADGSTATGQLFSTATQAGSQGIATQTPRDAQVELTVNDQPPGHVGTYADNGPTIVVNGQAGLRVRVVVAKGIIQPTDPYDDKLARQLQALSDQPFPANNAAEFQFADVTLTGQPLDISAEFDFSTIQGYDFQADPNRPLSVDEDKTPLAIIAAVIDPDHDNLPAGPVTRPIYLTHE
ncbi:MAG: hypothetical protein AAF823_02165 [Planctomycetota bacterium]